MVPVDAVLADLLYICWWTEDVSEGGREKGDVEGAERKLPFLGVAKDVKAVEGESLNLESESPLRFCFSRSCASSNPLSISVQQLASYDFPWIRPMLADLRGITLVPGSQNGSQLCKFRG